VSSRRRVAIQRSQIAFARGVWIGVLTIVMSSDSRTASKLAVYLVSRSRIGNRKESWRSMSRVGACWVTDGPVGVG
jgi:hypothetical protein